MKIVIERSLLLNAHVLWNKFCFYLEHFFFFKEKYSHIDFVSYKALMTQTVIFISDMIKVMWPVWENEFDKKKKKGTS